MNDDTNNPLTNEQQQKLATVLKEYLNVSDWKGLFEQTGCETFAQQYTHFYDEDSWDTGSIEDYLEQDCSEALAFILNKDGKYLKVIWEMPGVKTMCLRKDESFHAGIETLIENTDNLTAVVSSDISPSLTDKNRTPDEMLKDAEKLLASNRTTEAGGLIRIALHKFLNQICTNNEISVGENDSVSVLHARVNDFIKKQNNENLNNASLLRTTTLITETIDDLNDQNLDESQFSQADVKYAISVSRSVMAYIDELIA